MRKLVVNTMISLDGVMQSPGGPDEDPTGGFTYGGWGANYFDDEMMEPDGRVWPVRAAARPRDLRDLRRALAVRRGSDRRPAQQHPQACRLDDADEVEWNNSTLIRGDVADYVPALKRQEGPEIQVHGSPGLIQTLLEHDLIDEFRMWIFPLVIGTGKRFFGDGTIPGALKLVDSKVSKTGVTINVYERAGDINPGSFEFDEPTEAELERRRRLAAAAS